jgi:AcrR family transcriptional regulator
MGRQMLDHQQDGGRATRRAGRPPRELAGEVEQRILDAAQQVFLERGLGGASVDEIAARAGAGKPTIYARFPNKEALYAAVMLRMVESNISHAGLETISGTSLEERLASLARSLLRWMLSNDCIGLMRLAIAEARRFPDCASSVSGMMRDRGKAAIGRLLADAARTDELGSMPAFAPERLTVTTQQFVDVMVLPLLMRALMGTKPEAFQSDIEPHIARGVAFFLAGCRDVASRTPENSPSPANRRND